MKVTELSSLGVEQLTASQTGQVGPSQEKPREEQAGGGVDVIQLSPQARLMQKASQIAAQTPEVRPEKVMALQDSVQQGTYEVDSTKVANKMLADLLTEK
jgi:negative regulator of flagellin synthesis FlgM